MTVNSLDAAKVSVRRDEDIPSRNFPDKSYRIENYDRKIIRERKLTKKDQQVSFDFRPLLRLGHIQTCGSPGVFVPINVNLTR